MPRFVEKNELEDDCLAEAALNAHDSSVWSPRKRAFSHNIDNSNHSRNFQLHHPVVPKQV